MRELSTINTTTSCNLHQYTHHPRHTGSSSHDITEKQTRGSAAIRGDHRLTAKMPVYMRTPHYTKRCILYTCFLKTD